MNNLIKLAEETKSSLIELKNLADKRKTDFQKLETAHNTLKEETSTTLDKVNDCIETLDKMDI